ncbi:MAG: hypothetical protein ACR2NP_11805 [Pirellulaceae bacterium]
MFLSQRGSRSSLLALLACLVVSAGATTFASADIVNGAEAKTENTNNDALVQALPAADPLLVFQPANDAVSPRKAEFEFMLGRLMQYDQTNFPGDELCAVWDADCNCPTATIPEPSSFAFLALMMVIGISALGWQRRQRTSNAS